VSKLGVQRALGLPECATPPEEVYELAKRRGMDFVTITDHDTIDGALELTERYDDAFVSEELTAWFRGEPQAVHILVWGINPDDHERLQAPKSFASATSRARSPTRSTPSRRHCCRATAAGWRSCSESGRRATAHAPAS
jgi:DNA polymerase III alpha subunit